MHKSGNFRLFFGIFHLILCTKSASRRFTTAGMWPSHGKVMHRTGAYANVPQNDP
jgi:hypothetical protein